MSTDDNDRTRIGGRLPVAPPSEGQQHPPHQPVPSGQVPPVKAQDAASASLFHTPSPGTPGQPGPTPTPAPRHPQADGDRTVIGAAVAAPSAAAPAAAGPSASPFGGAPAPEGAGYGVAPGSRPAPGGANFGAVGGPQIPGQGIGQPTSGAAFGGGVPPSGHTWLGGALPPAPQHGGPPAYGGHAAGQPGGYYPAAPGHAPASIGQSAHPDSRGFFPDIPPEHIPQAPMVGPRIPLAAALQVKGLGRGSASNPLVAVAANLLILLGRLRTGLVEMQAAPLMDHVTREIDAFERNALMAGVNPHEALVAKYALSGTADDIVQNLPGADPGNWLQYSMVARFFHKRDSGVGFFQEVEKAMQAPAQHYNLLELMLTCLNLGFEGQYRTLPNGAVELSRIRSAIYETLRRVHPRPDDDISPMWAAVPLGKRRRWRVIPLPLVLGAGVFLIFAAFAGLTMWLNRDGVAIASELRGIGQGAPSIAIQRQTHVPPPAEIPSTQLERVRGELAPEIDGGLIEVAAKGEYIAIRVGNLQLFDSGSVEVKPGFAPISARIAEVLNAEGGPVLIQGHSDNVPLRSTNRFKSNDHLSLLRAEAVRDVLAGQIDDVTRMNVEGRGDGDPVAANDTEEGRAMNRRVEVLLRREGTWDAPDDAAPQTEISE